MDPAERTAQTSQGAAQLPDRPTGRFHRARAAPTDRLRISSAPGGTVLYSGPRALAALAVRRGEVFVLDPADGLLRLPQDKSEFERVVAGAVAEFLLADLNVYWSRDGGLWRASVAANDAIPDPVAAQLGLDPVLLRFDESYLYFADAAGRALLRAPISDGARETIASGVQVRDQVVHGGFVYFADAASARIQRVDVTGGSAEPASPGALGAPTALATDGKTVYWADGFELIATAQDGGMERRSLAVAGPSPARESAAVVRLELSGKRLYFSDDGGNLGWAAIDGSACGLLVKSAGVVAGSDIDAEGKNAYLSVDTGAAHELWRVALE